MKITEVLSKEVLDLVESLDSSYPYSVSGSRIKSFTFQVPEKETMSLLALRKEDVNFTVYSIALVNRSVDKNQAMNTTKTLTSTEALTVLGTCVKIIIDNLNDFDLIVARSEDDDPEQLDKKTRVYTSLAQRLVMKGVALNYEVSNFRGMPVILVMNKPFTNEQLSSIIQEFIEEKI